jgi:hypothetical protein
VEVAEAEVFMPTDEDDTWVGAASMTLVPAMAAANPDTAFNCFATCTYSSCTRLMDVIAKLYLAEINRVVADLLLDRFQLRCQPRESLLNDLVRFGHSVHEKHISCRW